MKHGQRGRLPIPTNQEIAKPKICIGRSLQFRHSIRAADLYEVRISQWSHFHGIPRHRRSIEPV